MYEQHKIQISSPGSITKEDWEYYCSFEVNDYINDILDSLKNKNRFFVDERFLKLIYHFLFDNNSIYQSQKYLESGMILYRARIYEKEDKSERYFAQKKYGRFKGYNKKDSGMPPVGMNVGAGRINPSNIRYFYLASDEETAVLEVSPHSKEFISIAKIKTNEHLFLADFSKNWSVISAENKDWEKWINEFILGINVLFSKPCSNSSEYYLCQYISEYIKCWGFDGIIFNSAKNPQPVGSPKGKNITLFNDKKCEVISSKLRYVIKVSVDMN